MCMKIGIMGGTFNPIHNAHLIMAEDALRELKLDKIVFIPAGNPPHKVIDPNSATDEQRIDMLKLALENNQDFQMDLWEIGQRDYTYTFKTLEYIKEKNKNSTLYFIMGEDSVVDFHTWKNPHRICELCEIVVAIRNKDDKMFDSEISKIIDTYKAVVHKLKMPYINISSSMLRARGRRKENIRYYVPENVWEYIEDNNLYKGE